MELWNECALLCMCEQHHTPTPRYSRRGAITEKKYIKMAASVREGGGATDPAALFPFVELEGSLKDEVGGLNAFLEQTHRDLTVWGIASICASTLLLLAFSCYPRVRRTPGWQFLYSSVCEIFVAGGFVALSLLDDGSSRGENMEHLICHDYSSLMLMILGFDMAANSWRLFMYVDLIVVYHNPFQPNTARPLYHVLVVLLVASWLVAITSSDVLCGAADGSVHVPALTWGLVYGPFLLFVLLGGSLYLAVKALLSKDTASHRISRLARQRVCATAPRPAPAPQLPKPCSPLHADDTRRPRLSARARRATGYAALLLLPRSLWRPPRPPLRRIRQLPRA